MVHLSEIWFSISSLCQANLLEVGVNLALIFQLNLRGIELEKTSKFNLAHKKEILLNQQSQVESRQHDSNKTLTFNVTIIFYLHYNYKCNLLVCQILYLLTC